MKKRSCRAQKVNEVRWEEVGEGQGSGVGG